MPAEGIHLTSLHEAVLARPDDARVAGARTLYGRQRDAARFGAVLIDLPYLEGFVGEVVRYALGRPPKQSPWGAILHEEQGGAVALLGAIVRRARGLAHGRHPDGDTLAGVALGLASHCAIDRLLHPLVNRLARERAVEKPGLTHGAAHRDVEKFQSVCFHERWAGRDLMGTRAVTEYIDVALPSRLGVTGRAVAAQLADAFADVAPASAPAPTARTLDGWARDYRRYARLLGSPVGGRLVTARDKEAARPRYLEGAWGRFDEILAAAIDASRPIVEAAADALAAAPADAAAADARLATLLPIGTIDGKGENVALDRPFAVGAVDGAAPVTG